MFRQSRKKRLQERQVNSIRIEKNTDYPHRLSFYLLPPTNEITVEEFEKWAIDRLNALAKIENEQSSVVASDERQLKSAIDKHLPLSSNSFSDTYEERKKDHYSHYILRLAFCKTPELRDKFIKLETSLFKLRYNTDTTADRQAFIDSLDFAWEPVQQSEIEQLNLSTKEAHYKVDFEQVPELIANRSVTLYKGKAYIPTSLQFTLVIGDFQSRLKNALEMTARAIPRLDEDDRLVPILNRMPHIMPIHTYKSPNRNGEFKAEDIEGLSRQHFPLCMKHMHNTSMASSHAYYDVRQQYGAFLKGIGLTVEESIRFWHLVFRNLSEDEYKKKYIYNIRHMYALEGSRIDFKPLDCLQITKSTGSGHHGCPYRTFSAANLSTSLQKMGISDKQELANINKFVSEQKYHIACTRVYELTHPKDDTNYEESAITTPVQYFDRSYDFSKRVSEPVTE